MTISLLPVLLTLASAASAAPVAIQAAEPCPIELVAGGAGENHVFFHGVSPDGRTLAVGWDSGTGANIRRGAYLLDLRTRHKTDIPHLNNAPSFSPDAKSLIAANYSGERTLRTEIVELDRRTGQARTHASGPSFEWLPSYSRDGRWILFNSTRSGGSDLYRMRRSDHKLEQLTRDPVYEAHGQSVQGDREILFHRQVAGDNYDLAILDLASGQSRAVGATALEEAYPALSPDGRWIAFSAVARPGEQANLFVMAASGDERRRLTRGSGKDAYAGWAPDGSFLYFVRFADQGSRIHRIPMKGGRCPERKP